MAADPVLMCLRTKIEKQDASNERRFCSGHLGQRKLESEAGFGSLILIDTIGMQCVVTATRTGIVEWLPKIVAPEEPFEASTRSPVASRVAGQRVRFHTSGDHGIGFKWLLIKACAFVVAGPESIAADRREMTTFSPLLLHQPAERL